MLSPLAPSEAVTRHRGGGRDEDGKLVTEDDPVTLMAIAVAPGGGSDQSGRARTGELVECTVYFAAGTDVVNSDELTVRGKRFRIVVSDWQLSSASVGGMQVSCVRGEG